MPCVSLDPSFDRPLFVDRNQVKARDCGLCRKCRAPDSTVDHFVPLWTGGSDESENKQTLCAPCHDEKTAQEPLSAPMAFDQPIAEGH